MSRSVGHQERALALRFAPVLRVDRGEPFLPVAVGYHVFYADGPSPSFPRTVSLTLPAPPRPAAHEAGLVLAPQGGRAAANLPAPPGSDNGPQGGADRADAAIEYAIYWDWDIGHLYELEHVWVYVAGGSVQAVEGSWHGRYHLLFPSREPASFTADRPPRPIVVAEPGKHALAPSESWFSAMAGEVRLRCSREAGVGGVWVTPLFEGRIPWKNAATDRLVHSYLWQRRFEPTLVFDRQVDLRDVPFFPWRQLERRIPQRVRAWLRRLEAEVPPHRRRFLRIAHRGASAHAPENTARAFELAAELGADMVELDVRLTRDGVPVVIHDPVLERLTDGHGAVAERTWEYLRGRTVRGGGRLLALSEALELLARLRLGVYVDIKAKEAALPAAAELERAGLTPYAIMGSHDPELLRELRRQNPKLRTSLLVGPPDQLGRGVWLALQAASELAARIQCDYVHPCWEHVSDRPDRLLDPAWIDAVHRAGRGVITWHEERAAVIEGLRQLGVDGICTDRPELLTTGDGRQ